MNVKGSIFHCYLILPECVQKRYWKVTILEPGNQETSYRGPVGQNNRHETYMLDMRYAASQEQSIVFFLWDLLWLMLRGWNSVEWYFDHRLPIIRIPTAASSAPCHWSWTEVKIHKSCRHPTKSSLGEGPSREQIHIPPGETSSTQKCQKVGGILKCKYTLKNENQIRNLSEFFSWTSASEKNMRRTTVPP